MFRYAMNFFYVCLILFIYGCQTVKPSPSVNADDDIDAALHEVAEALTGKELSQKDMKNLEKQIRHDKEARSAIDSIQDSLSNKKPVVKYSPVTGKRYAESMEFDPETGVKLEILE